MKCVLKIEGFSLLEMLVVLALVALAAALSFPLLRSSQSEREVVAFQTTVLEELKEARNKALLVGIDQYVQLDLKKKLLTGHRGQSASYSDAVSVSARSAKSEDESDIATFVLFANGSSSGGKILIYQNLPSGADRIGTLEISLNWFSGEVVSSRGVMGDDR